MLNENLRQSQSDFRGSLREPGLIPKAPDDIPRFEVSDNGSPCWKVLQRFSWTAGLAFSSHGVRLGIRVTEAALMERLSAHLPPEWSLSPSREVESLFSVAEVKSRSKTSQEPHYFLYRDSCRLAHARNVDEILEGLESLLHSEVASRAKEKIFVHAGVVAWQGKAIVIPGRSFSGKTSLVTALVKAGATYLSDEYAVFDSQGIVHPYLKLLSVRGEDGKSRLRCSAESLGGKSGTEPLPVGMIVATRYEDGASWRPHTMPEGAALLALLDNTVRIRENPSQSLSTLQTVVLKAPALKSKRGDAEKVAQWLLANMPIDSLN